MSCPSDLYSTPMQSNIKKNTGTAELQFLQDIFFVPYKNILWPATLLPIDDFVEQARHSPEKPSEYLQNVIMHSQMFAYLGGEEKQVATLLGYSKSTEDAPKILVPVVEQGDSRAFGNLGRALSQLETPTLFNKDKSLFMTFAGALDEVRAIQKISCAELSSFVDKAQGTWLEAYGTTEDSRDSRVPPSETPPSTLAAQVSLSDCSKQGGPVTPKHSNSSHPPPSSFVTPMNTGRTHAVVTDCSKKSAPAGNEESAAVANKKASLLDHGIKRKDSFKVATRKLQECGWGTTSREGEQLWLAPGTYIELATRGVHLFSSLELREYLSKNCGWNREAPPSTKKVKKTKSKKAIADFTVRRQSARAKKEAVPPGQPAVESLKKKKVREPDEFYQFNNLIRYLQEERGWLYTTSCKGHNWVYVRNAKVPEAKGEHLIDYFYSEEEVIEYAKANNFKHVYEKNKPAMVTPTRN